MVEQTSLDNNKPCGHVASAKGVRAGDMMRQSSTSASSDNPSTSDQYPNDTDDSVAPNILYTKAQEKNYIEISCDWVIDAYS